MGREFYMGWIVIAAIIVILFVGEACLVIPDRLPFVKKWRKKK